MEAKEMKIGNYVKDGIDVICLDNDSMICTLVGRCEFDPIPLTEYWLLRFGLKMMEVSEYTLNTYDLAGFKLWMNKGKFLFNDTLEIKHVHQLQNLYFALTGKELEITK